MVSPALPPLFVNHQASNQGLRQTIYLWARPGPGRAWYIYIFFICEKPFLYMCRCRYFHLTYFQHLTDFSKTTNIGLKENRTKQFVLSHNCFSENIYIYVQMQMKIKYYYSNLNQVLLLVLNQVLLLVLNQVLLLNILAKQIIIMQRPTYRQPYSQKTDKRPHIHTVIRQTDSHTHDQRTLTCR